MPKTIALPFLLLTVAAWADETRRLEWKPRSGDRYDFSMVCTVVSEDTTQGQEKETRRDADVVGELRILECSDDRGAKGVLRFRRIRATAYLGLGKVEAAGGKDPRADLERGIADFGEALRRSPGLARAYSHRGAAYVDLGQAEDAYGVDSRGSYRWAITDHDEALSAPGSATSYYDRGTAYSNLGKAEAARGGDPGASYQRASDDFGEALRRNPNLWQAHGNLGHLDEAMGEPGKAVKAYEAALSIVGEAYAPLKKCLMKAHYGLGRVLALASAGKSGPSAEAQPIDAAESARLREVAFRHLRQALELGYADAKRIAEDPDLAPLRDDTRWEQLLQAMGK